MSQNKQKIEDRLDFPMVLYKIIDHANSAAIQGNLTALTRCLLVLKFNLSPWLEDKDKTAWAEAKHDSKLETWFNRLGVLLAVADRMGLLLDKREQDDW